MKLKKWFLPLCVVALLLSCFAGCGAKAANDMAASEPKAEAYYDNGYYAAGGSGINYTDAEEEYSITESGGDAPEAQTVSDEATKNKNLKLVYTVDMRIETLNYDTSVQSIEALTEQFGGYIEYSQVENDHINSHWLRNASFTLRIPAAQLDAFVSSCGDVGNVCSVGKRTENRTTEYTDLASRLDTLQIEEKSLQELLEDAKDLDSIVALHGYLSDVRYQIEQIQTRMRGIDGLVSYSTVNLYLEEVTVASEVVTPKSSFGERLSARMHNSWRSFCDGMENFGVFMLGELPLFLLKLILVLLPFAIIVFVIILLVRKGRDKRAAKRAARQERKARKKNLVPAAPQVPEDKQE